jgi:hypothetical protein
MRSAFWVLVAVALMAAPPVVQAGYNPHVRAFISFAPAAPDPYVFTTAWAGEKVYNSYLCIDCFGLGYPADKIGARVVSLQWVTAWSDPSYPPDVIAAVYYPVGSQVIGGPDQENWVIAWTDCEPPNAAGIIKVLKQGYYCYQPMTITLQGNTVDGKMVVDCDFGADQFCVLGNGGIGMDAPAGDGTCDTCIDTPVQEETWGAIKALYR